MNTEVSDLVDVYVLRTLHAANGYDKAPPDPQQFEYCLALHGIVCQRSYLASNGEQLLCHFRAPDAESLRTALRVARIEYDALWTAKNKGLTGTAWRENHD